MERGKQHCLLGGVSWSLYPRNCRFSGSILRPKVSVVGSGRWCSLKDATTFEMADTTVPHRRECRDVRPRRLFRTSFAYAHVISPLLCVEKEVRNTSSIPHRRRNSRHWVNWPVYFFLVVAAIPLCMSIRARRIRSRR